MDDYPSNTLDFYSSTNMCIVNLFWTRVGLFDFTVIFVLQ